MIKNRLTSIILVAILALGMLPMSAAADENATLLISPNPSATDTAAEAESEWTPPLSIAEPLPAGNTLLGRSAFNKAEYIADWRANHASVAYVEDENGGYIRVSDATYNYIGPEYIVRGYPSAGTYKFTGYFRTANHDEISRIRVNFIDSDGNTIRVLHVNLTDEWIKAEFYFEVTDVVSKIMICGGPYTEFIQDYCLDNFSLVEVDSIPEGKAGNTVGEEVSPEDAFMSMLHGDMYIKPYDAEENAQYEKQGIIINGDNTFFLLDIAEGGYSATEQDIIDYAKQFAGTHMTDYMICVNSQGAVYPSLFDTDYLEKYDTVVENGLAVDYKNEQLVLAAKHVYETLGTDYIGLWCEAFREVGINPWISFRMNDIHDQRAEKTSVAFSDFWYKNPQFYRVTHRKIRENNGYALNYTHREVRDYFLGKINEALNRYDCYGIELDFQREMWLWHIGGEYRGMEILNEFMYEVQDLVAIYEEKYGHEIKIGVRVASNPVTCYELGFDIVKWASEGIIDLVSPGGRFATTDTDIPVKLWDSILSPFNVELAPGIEQIYASYRDQLVIYGEKRHNLDTLAACAATMLSQGADKVYFYNYFYGLPNPVKHVSTNTTLYTVTSPEGYWNALTTLGSYDKLMTFNRRHVLTFDDTYQLWRNSNEQLPRDLSRNQPTYFSITVGDVPDYADVYLKFSSSEADGTHSTTPPTVYTNSAEAEFIGFEAPNGMTDYKLLVYKVPDSVKNGGRIVFEVNSTVKCTIDYAEVYVETFSSK